MGGNTPRFRVHGNARKLIHGAAWNEPCALRLPMYCLCLAVLRFLSSRLFPLAFVHVVLGVALVCPSFGQNGNREWRKKAGVVLFLCCRGFCISLKAVFPPLQVVLSSACSVASLSRFPSHYLPGHLHLREGALADYPFGKGNPST